ncbi:MAG: DinB family protein [Anaerolineae bacterium]|nr:DinB family protein [Anaerolineae bacterium]
MANVMEKGLFLEDLRAKIQANGEVVALFQPLSLAQLQWQPEPKEWNILQCFDHLNLTHDYYTPKIEAALAAPQPVLLRDVYQPSFWGRIYMYFSFNPKYSFPAAAEIAPDTAVTLDATTFNHYLARQETFLDFLERVADIDLTHTRIPIARGVNFNLGDCLKVLAYHDALHISQAQRVLASAREHNV